MSGTTAVTQTVASYVCQTIGNGVSLQLNALDSIDPNEIADGATALVEAGDQFWKWYQTDGTVPGASVVAPLIPLALTPTLGRWKLQSGAVPPGIFYQFIQNTPLGLTMAPVNLADVSPPQAPTIRFQNMLSTGSNGVETVITAFNQQIIYWDNVVPFGPQPMIQRPRLMFESLDTVSATPGQILQVVDSAATESTVVQFYEPAYQQVNNLYTSKNLKFLGNVTVTDDGSGTETVVTITSAAAIAGWHDVLVAGNMSSVLGVSGLPTLNQGDYLTLMDGAYIQFSTTSNRLLWVGSGVGDGATFTYAGAGSAPSGAPIQITAPSTVSGNAGAYVNIFSASAGNGGPIRWVAGAGAAVGSPGGFVEARAGDSASGVGGYFLFTAGLCGDASTIGGTFTANLGAGNTGGGFFFNPGAGSVVGGGTAFTAGPGGTTGGSFTVATGFGGALAGATFKVYGGNAGVVGQPGFVEIEPLLHFIDNVAYPAWTPPTGGGYLFSHTPGGGGGVSTLYWRSTDGSVTKIAPP